MLAVGGADGDHRERGRLLGVVQRLRGGHLHRLDLGHHLALDVTGDQQAQTGDQQGHGTELDRGPEGHAVSSGSVCCRIGGLVTGPLRSGGPFVEPPQVPTGHPGDERPTNHEAAEDLMRKGDQHDRVGEHRCEVGQLRASPNLVERESDRILHEGVRGQDEVARSSTVPDAASQIVARCSLGSSFPQPKIQSPRNVDSKRMPAALRARARAPKMSPTKRSRRSSSCRTGTPARCQ